MNTLPPRQKATETPAPRASSQLVIDVGNADNDGTGDPVRDSMVKCNANFAELFSRTAIIPIKKVAVPMTATSVGTPDSVAWDANYFYICVATNKWKRSAIGSWGESLY